MNLRERRKSRDHDAIASAARSLFVEKGFEDVSMANVAEFAEVSVGTVYNHFHSKNELFVACMQPEHDSLEAETPEFSSAVSLIEFFFEALLAMLGEYPRKLMREIVSAAAGMDSNLGVLLMRQDQKLMAALAQGAATLQEKGLISGGVDVSVFIRTIYSVAAAESFIYIFDESMTIDELRGNLQGAGQFILRALTREGEK